MKPPIIVIDALDECDDRELMKEFIEAVIYAVPDGHRLPLRILITSRVEEHIQEALETPAAISAVHRLSLTDFDASSDIHSFFCQRLSALHHSKRRLMKDVLRPWPSPWDLHTLVQNSQGSFLFATILTDLIGARGLPQDNLQMALTAEDGLDPLYTQVLEAAPRDHNFMWVIGAVMLLEEPIQIVFLAHLLQLRPADIVQTLTGMQSVLIIPDRDNQPIRLLHTSLRDFLTSPERSHHFFIYPQVQHLWIVANCLRVLMIGQTDDIFYGDREEYACSHWCHHLERGMTLAGEDLPALIMKFRLVDLLKEFMSTSMDIWLNTSLWLGRKQLDSLRSAIRELEVGHL